MSKAILVMDMPENCLKCPMCNSNDECLLQDEDANFNASDSWEELKKGCPLHEIPQKEEVYLSINNEKGYCEGYNACIDEILERGAE